VQYPHETYVTYLLSKQRTDAQLAAECEQMGLDVLPDDEVARRRAAFPSYPSSWRPQLNRHDLTFARWLRDLGVLALWQEAPAVQGAREVLTSVRLRRAAEALLILIPDTREIRRLLTQIKYVRPPSEAVLETYRATFWDFSKMSPRQAAAYVTKHGDNRPELHYALAGQERSALGAVGIMADLPRPESALDEALDLTLQMAERARRNVDDMPSSGTISLLGGLGRLLEARERQQRAGGGGMKDRARAFKLANAHIPSIPSIDDIQAGDLEVRDVNAVGDAG
jgi:hypothetical protein